MENRGKMVENRGTMVENRGKMVENRGKMVENRGKMVDNHRKTMGTALTFHPHPCCLTEGLDQPHRMPGLT